VRYVAFVSWATNLVPGFVANGKSQVYLKDRVTGQIVAVSAVNNNTMGGNEDSLSATISANGRFVAWSSRADNLVPGDNNASSDIFLHDMQTGVLTRVSVDKFGTQGNAPSGSPSISPDGCRVEFASNATNWILDSGYYDNFGDVSIFTAGLICATNTMGP
jgi:Tol biopolymer transport system component